MGPTREGRKWAQPAWWHSSSLGRYLTEEWRLPQERVPACMVDARHWLAVKIAQQDNVFKERKTVQKEIYWLYKERGIILSLFFLIIIFFSSAMNHANICHALFHFSLQYHWISIVWLSYHFRAILQLLLLYLGTDKWMCSLMRNILLYDHLSGWKTIKFPLIWYIIHGYF